MAQAIVKGNIALTVEAGELEARLEFRPDPEGGEWTSDKVQKLALDARLPPLGPKRAEEILSKFARSKGAASEIIAQGIAPEAPLSESASWDAHPVPEELRGLVEEVLASAPAPILYRTSVKTVRTEKQVSKPGAFPFMRARVETVVATDKVESKEAVFPDPEVLASGLARKGEILGGFVPSKPGKVGKSIFGKPLPFVGEAETFILGRGISRNKNNLVADEDGIFRAGARWAEILPFAAHAFQVSRSSDGITLVLDYQPGHPGLPRPTAQAVLEAARTLQGGEGGLIEAADIDAALAAASSSGRPLSAFPLSPDRDASVAVELSPDGTKAILTARKGRGRGRLLELAAVTAAIKASGLRGFDAEALKKTILEFYKGPEEELHHVFLEGKEPQRGKDRGLTLALTPLAKEKADPLRTRLIAQVEAGAELPGAADFPLGPATLLAFVVAGQKIGELSPPDPGQAGMDVRGKVIPGLPGNDPSIRCLEGAVFARGTVTASRAGLLMAEKGPEGWSFRVTPCRDARIEVAVSSDGMEGLLTLQAEEGLGSPLDVEAVIEAIGMRGVVFGLDPRRIAEAVADARAGKVVQRRPVARGKPAVPAGGHRVEWLVSPDGAAPARGLRVAAGQELVRLVATGAAESQGQDVLGKLLRPPEQADSVDLPRHDATLAETEKGGVRSLVATKAGELVLGEGPATIRDRLSLARDIGPAEGELRFGGSIDIQGSILQGSKVFAGGDLRVSGLVEAAVVSSEGSVTGLGGVKGGKRGTIRAMRKLDLAFSEQALLLAVEDIVIRASCMLSNVKTNGRLSVLGERGALVGGLIRARRGVEAVNLGSANGIKTEVAFGQDYLVADMIENEAREIEKVKTAILQADRTMAELQRAGAGLDQIRLDKVKLLKLLEKRSMRIFDFREKFEQHHESEVIVRGTVFPGVILESHSRYFEIKSRRNAVVFSFDPSNGRIVERPLK